MPEAIRRISIWHLRGDFGSAAHVTWTPLSPRTQARLLGHRSPSPAPLVTIQALPWENQSHYFTTGVRPPLLYNLGGLVATDDLLLSGMSCS